MKWPDNGMKICSRVTGVGIAMTPGILRKIFDDKSATRITDYVNEYILRDKIKFELVFKETRLEFLDVKVHLNIGYLVPEIYFKETDSHEYLNPNSVHPPSVVKNNQ